MPKPPTEVKPATEAWAAPTQISTRRLTVISTNFKMPVRSRKVGRGIRIMCKLGVIKIDPKTEPESAITETILLAVATPECFFVGKKGGEKKCKLSWAHFRSWANYFSKNLSACLINGTP